MFVIRNESGQDISISVKGQDGFKVLAGDRIFISEEILRDAIFPKAVMSIKAGTIKIKKVL